MFDGGGHEIAHVLGGDAGSGDYEAHCLAIAAVEQEGAPHLLAIVAADLEAVGAPAGVAGIDRDTSVVPPFVSPCRYGASAADHPTPPFERPNS